MTEKVVKEGYELAEKELKEKQVQEVKQIVLKTLEKIKDQEKIRDEAIDKIKLLKMDIDDLKEGKLDRIEERQAKDPEAKKTSVVIIIKEKVIETINPWYVPYHIVWNEPYITYYDINNRTNVATVSSTVSNFPSLGTATNAIDINCSVAKDAVVGAYTLESGVVHLR